MAARLPDAGFAEVFAGDRRDEPRNVDFYGAAGDALGLFAHDAAVGLSQRILHGVAERHLIEIVDPLFRILLCDRRAGRRDAGGARCDARAAL